MPVYETNKTQLQHLVTLMEAKSGIACGFHKGNKETLARHMMAFSFIFIFL